VRVTLLLEEKDLGDIVKTIATLPTDLQELVAHNKRVVKTKRMIMVAIKDHLIPHGSGKKTAKDMFNALVSLYQNRNINREQTPIHNDDQFRHSHQLPYEDHTDS
jgi:hypothetical protein